MDQFKRASFSIVLNIAEGAGKFKQADKQGYSSIARGSIMECGALFDLLNALNYLCPDEYRAGKRLLTRIAAVPSARMMPASGTFTFTCTSTFTSG